MNPAVSVIIPAYNTERYIAHAVQSALDQTESNIEVIVVDDGSGDSTATIVKGFADKRITLLNTTNNSGPGHARNRALKEAKGDWIAILDSDDWYAPERLARLLEVAQAENADLVADNLYMIHDNEKLPWGTLFSQHGGKLRGLVTINAINFVESSLPGIEYLGLGSAKPLIRRSFLMQHGLKYDESLRCGEDFSLYLLCLLSGARFTVIPEAHYFYRSRQDSIIAADILDNLDQLRLVSLNLLQEEFIRSNPALAQALSRRLALIEKRIIYYRIVQPFKDGLYSAAFTQMASHPDFFPLFMARVPEMLRSRFRRSLRKIKNPLNKK